MKGLEMCIYENSERFVFCLTAGMLANNLGQSGHISLTYLLGADSAAEGYYHHVYYKKFLFYSDFFSEIFLHIHTSSES